MGAFSVIVKLQTSRRFAPALVLTDMYPFARYLLLKRSLFVGLFAKQEAEQTGGQRAREGELHGIILLDVIKITLDRHRARTNYPPYTGLRTLVCIGTRMWVTSQHRDNIMSQSRHGNLVTLSLRTII